MGELHKLKVTTDMLRATKIGVTVNKLPNRFPDHPLADRARRVVATWKLAMSVGGKPSGVAQPETPGARTPSARPSPLKRPAPAAGEPPLKVPRVAPRGAASATRDE